MGDRSGKCPVQPFNMNGNAERVKGESPRSRSVWSSKQLSKFFQPNCNFIVWRDYTYGCCVLECFHR